MTTIRSTYEGTLRTRAVHLQSGNELVTDAPTDNHGKGESFSPTDLVATSLGSCMLTLMGILAQRHDWNIEGATAEVVKVMSANPRRIARLEVRITVPGEHDERARASLEKAALGCPVHATLGGNVELPVEFVWPG